MAGTFELKTTSNGKYLFNLKAGNGQVILTSETYEQKASALNGIESVRKNAATEANFDRRTAKSGEPYFVLLAGNKQEIGRSEMYSGASALENGIASVKTNAPAAKVDDTTA